MKADTIDRMDGAAPRLVEPRRISVDDLRAVLREGFEDFRAKPSHVIFLAALYPVLGVIVTSMAAGGSAIELIFPLVSGFALVGPVAAIGLYEISRQRELGRDPTWRDAIGVATGPAAGAVAVIALVLAAVFAVWLATAQALWGVIMGGEQPQSIGALIAAVTGRPEGLTLIVVGHAVGAGFAFVAMAISVFSLPMALDGERSPVHAMVNSVRAVLANLPVMLIWGVIVGAIMVVASAPLMVGLAVALPVLGHATWRLYRRVFPR